jgi:hypothetical protein
MLLIIPSHATIGIYIYRQDPFSLEYPESSHFPAEGAVGEDELPRVECVSHTYPTRTVLSSTEWPRWP